MHKSDSDHAKYSRQYASWGATKTVHSHSVASSSRRGSLWSPPATTRRRTPPAFTLTIEVVSNQLVSFCRGEDVRRVHIIHSWMLTINFCASKNTCVFCWVASCRPRTFKRVRLGERFAQGTMETRWAVGRRLTGEFSRSFAAACFYTAARFARSRWRRSLACRFGGAKSAPL